MNLQHNLAKIQADAIPEHYEAELEINDIPQNAQWRVPGPGDCKLYLFIEGCSEQSVKRGKAELKRKLGEIMNQALSLPAGTRQRRYQLFKRCGRGAIFQFKGMYVFQNLLAHVVFLFVFMWVL
ncbi:hypothetical protein ACFX1X_024199 [Malus domestica]